MWILLFGITAASAIGLSVAVIVMESYGEKVRS
jgi:hypothetical protein